MDAEINQASHSEDTLLARQPIFDRQLQVYGYELLFRDNETLDTAVINDGAHASRAVILNAFTATNLKTFSHNVPAFINLPRTMLIDNHSLPFNPNQVIIEILEDTQIDERLINCVKHHREQGYRYALDDFIYDDSYQAILPYVDFIKFDVLAMSDEQLRQQVARVKSDSIKLIAEKIETYSDFQRCIDLDFDYFQGYFLSKPHVVKGKKLTTNIDIVVRLLKLLQQPELTAREVEQLIAQDTALSYKLLRLLDCFNPQRETIESLQDAIERLGRDKIRNWAMLIAMVDINTKPEALTQTNLIRAKMCELLAKHLQYSHSEKFFTAGLLSGLDAVVDLPMPSLLESLPLSTEIRAAILNNEGELGEVLAIVLAHEQANWQKLSQYNIANPILHRAYALSIAWADQISQNLL